MGTGERALALAATLVGAGVLIATSVYGGRLVFDHAAGIPTEVLTAESRSRTEGHEHGPGEGHGDDGHSHDVSPADTTTTDSPDTAGAAAGATDSHSHPAGTPAHDH